MSLQPHKEERFLYPVYPLICVAASAVIDSFPSLFESEYKTTVKDLAANVAKFVRPIVLSIILGVSHSRTFSLIHGYGAPIEVYKILEHHDEVGHGSVLCVGSEWHRFPSSFFVPDFVGEVRWIDDGFDGLLPMPFNSTLGGTSAAPSYFNNRNKASEEQYLHDLDACTFLVELQLSRPYPTRGNDLSKWEVIAALPYLDRELSPSFYRSTSSQKYTILISISLVEYALTFRKINGEPRTSNKDSLLSAPNPDDPLSENITKHWKTNEAEAVETAKEWTQLWIRFYLMSRV
ncbi:hypothetical protein MLD38_035147 [Melastoma candidum]|uniref:Uncharacterized protein n=1 Tax=Melastoma candidum TaxID=119954 RepID=A0ACB9MBV0_9MYRT|nr:hypothetical protein MLD38_035147 [Melastoma candidum]